MTTGDETVGSNTAPTGGESLLPRLRRPEPLATRAYERIREMLLSTDGPRLERLVERDLAKQLSMSRTPVREALKRLAVLGLVEASAGGGYVPRRASIRDVNEYYDLRLLLEPFAASVAAGRSRREAQLDLPPMSEIRKRSPEANALFHRAIARASGNRVLAEVIETLIERVVSQRIYAEGDGSPPHTLVGGHDAIAQAIVRGEPEVAATLLRDHLMIAREWALRELQDWRDAGD